MIAPADDGFDEPFNDAADPGGLDGFGMHLDLRLLIGVFVLVMLVFGLVWLARAWGRRNGRKALMAQRKESAQAIYKSVRWYLDRALKSSGAVILERAREVAEVLNARLGYVIDLSAKQGKMLGELDAALSGEKKPPADPTPKVKVPRATDEHYHEVWKALQALNAFWQEDRVMKMIAEAQDELARPPKKETPAQMLSRLTAPKASSTNAVPKAEKAKKTGKAEAEAPLPDAPQPVAPKPAATDETPAPEPTPPPPPPAPPPNKGKKLPAHKRNMLA